MCLKVKGAENIMSRLDLYSKKVNLIPVLRIQGGWKGKERIGRDQFREGCSDLGEKWPKELRQ